MCPVGLNLNGLILPCYGNGICRSLRDINIRPDYNQYANIIHYNGWDADMMYGCDCDPGFGGVACSMRTCPVGIDPVDPGLTEIQVIDCICTSNCVGAVRLTFNGKTTAPIPHDSSPLAVKRALERLSNIDDVTVAIPVGDTLCSTGSGSITKVQFNVPYSKIGPMSAKGDLTFQGASGQTVEVHSGGVGSQVQWGFPSRSSTLREKVCSGRGMCDPMSGMCECFPGYVSTNGTNGVRGDCGYMLNGITTTTYTPSGGSEQTITSRCPGVVLDDDYLLTTCSNHGTCNADSGECDCNMGYTGGDCALKSCPRVRSWFGEIQDDRIGTSICGGVGDCDYSSGACYNCGGSWGLYNGTGCEVMSCAASIDSEDGSLKTCGGNGVCMSLRQMAPYSYNEKKEMSFFSYTTPWDADMIRGCSCFRAVSVNNQYYIDYLIPQDGTSYATGIQVESTGEAAAADVSFAYNITKYYRGPYSYSATDWTGFACADALCPKGDNPLTIFGQNEIQKVSCHADGGDFQMFFRENVTMFIDWEATVAEFEYALEQIFTINSATVTMVDKVTGADASDAICSILDSRYLTVEFLTEFGDLPLMRVVSNRLTHSTDDTLVVTSVSEIQKGTKEDVECSGQGICHRNGRCSCMEGFGSSDGTRSNAGERGDCTFRNPFSTNFYYTDVAYEDKD